jgi:hypothetical protein
MRLAASAPRLPPSSFLHLPPSIPHPHSSIFNPPSSGPDVNPPSSDLGLSSSSSVLRLPASSRIPPSSFLHLQSSVFPPPSSVFRPPSSFLSPLSSVLFCTRHRLRRAPLLTWVLTGMELIMSPEFAPASPISHSRSRCLTRSHPAIFYACAPHERSFSTTGRERTPRLAILCSQFH